MNAPAICRNLRRTRHIPKRSQQDEIAAPAFHSRIIVFFLRYPITAKTSSNWMVCLLMLGTWITVNWKSHPLPDKHGELNRAVTGRWRSTVTVRATLFFYKSTICLRISNIVIYLVYIHTFFLLRAQGGYCPPLNSLFFSFKSHFLGTAQKCKVE